MGSKSHWGLHQNHLTLFPDLSSLQVPQWYLSGVQAVCDLPNSHPTPYWPTLPHWWPNQGSHMPCSGMAYVYRDRRRCPLYLSITASAGDPALPQVRISRYGYVRWARSHMLLCPGSAPARIQCPELTWRPKEQSSWREHCGFSGTVLQQKAAMLGAGGPGALAGQHLDAAVLVWTSGLCAGKQKLCSQVDLAGRKPHAYLGGVLSLKLHCWPHAQSTGQEAREGRSHAQRSNNA